MYRALFIHGGPGLNAEAERRVLAGDLTKAGFDFRFWNEPSSNRPNGYPFDATRGFTGWLESLEAETRTFGPFDMVVGSSFGALAALHLIERNPNAFRAAVMIAPIVDLTTTFRRMMSMAAGDFDSSAPETASRLRELEAGTRTFHDEAARSGMALVYTDPLLFGHYWVNKPKLTEWAAILDEPSFAFDFASQAAVLEELAHMPHPQPPATPAIPLALMLGESDPVMDEAATVSQLRPWFEPISTHRLAESAHFPHLEEPHEFIEALQRFCSSL